MNCVHHSWQPALGACTRCGDFVCLRCVSPEAAAELRPLCLACAEQQGPGAETLPYDGDGSWLAILSETSLRVLKEPQRTFSRMADTPFDPAWRFAWGWALLVQLPLFALAPSIGSFFITPITTALSVTLAMVVRGTIHHLCVRAFGGRARWKLSARTIGYATPWWAPVTAVAGLLAMSTPTSA